MYALIGTWELSLKGMLEASEILRRGGSADDAVLRAVTRAEDDPEYESVGYGGLPDRNGRVTCDAAFMDGDTLRFGAVMAVEGIANPVLAAKKLCGRTMNCVLAGRGAEQFAVAQGLAMRDMRTARSMDKWRAEVGAGRDGFPRGHDTVCVIGRDGTGHMCVGTSTSGLFLKEEGRVGDTPVIGSGFYCDSRVGGAAATGLGEDIMRGCLSYAIVCAMERGLDPTQACLEALGKCLRKRRALGEGDGEMSVIALRSDGAFGAATTLDRFPYNAGRDRDAEPLCCAKAVLSD